MKRILGKPNETNSKLISLIQRVKINNFYLKNRKDFREQILSSIDPQDDVLDIGKAMRDKHQKIISKSLETLDVKENDVVKLRQPNEVYMEIWREARKRAKQARKTAIEAYLEAKNIKSTYMINEIDDSDSEDEIDNIVNSMESEDGGSKSLISLG